MTEGTQSFCFCPIDILLGMPSVHGFRILVLLLVSSLVFSLSRVCPRECLGQLENPVMSGHHGWSCEGILLKSLAESRIMSWLIPPTVCCGSYAMLSGSEAVLWLPLMQYVEKESAKMLARCLCMGDLTSNWLRHCRPGLLMRNGYQLPSCW